MEPLKPGGNAMNQPFQGPGKGPLKIARVYRAMRGNLSWYLLLLFIAIHANHCCLLLQISWHSPRISALDAAPTAFRRRRPLWTPPFAS